MAGDWLKMTHALPEKPEVLEIAGRTSLSRFDVVGRLFILWRWFDTNTVDGNARGVTKVTLNACLFGDGDVTNFVSAVVDARWLTVTDDGISVVKFDSHISESAKTRGQTAKRVAKSKANAGNAEGNAKTVTKTVPREEKRREEKINTEEGKSSPNGSRIPAGWQMDSEDRTYCQTTRPDLDPDAVALDFFQHWSNTPGAKGRKLNWRLTWQTWVRGQFAKKTSPYAKPAPNATVPGKAERDPELTRLDIERKRAVPMPAAIREQMEKIKLGASQ